MTKSEEEGTRTSCESCLITQRHFHEYPLSKEYREATARRQIEVRRRSREGKGSRLARRACENDLRVRGCRWQRRGRRKEQRDDGEGGRTDGRTESRSVVGQTLSLQEEVGAPAYPSFFPSVCLTDHVGQWD